MNPGTTSGNTVQTPTPTEGTTQVPTEGTTETTASPAGCRITISNRLVSILETPEVFGQEIVWVPAGEYPVLAIEDTNFGGLQDQRWFKISVDGREGWVMDSTFEVAAKSADCP